MTVAAGAPKILRFGAFEVDLDAGELRKQGKRVKLQEQPLQVLGILLERPGAMVTREDLRSRIWPQDTFVDFDNSLNTAISKLREALGDSASNPRFIETLPRRGYRFIAQVEAVPNGGAALSQVSAQGPLEVTPSQKDASFSVRPPAVALPVARSAIRWKVLLTAAAVVAVAALAWLGVRWNRPVRNQQAPIRSVAILPLENLSADPEQEYFAEGMTDELITDLAQVSGLRVTSRSSVMHYKHTQKTLPQIASELNVDAVVEGTLARAGDRVRIRVQLIRAADDRHLWAHAYDREYRDVLLLQSEAARDIAQAINLKLVPSNLLDRTRALPMSPEAYDAYLKGRYFWNDRSREGNAKSVAYFEQAVQLAPDSAMAYSGLADAYIDGAYLGDTPSAAAAKSRTVVTKALELDPNLAEAHVSLAGILEEYDWNWKEADKEYQRGLELNPNYAFGHHIYAIFLAFMGRFDQAIAHIRTAQQLDPVSPSVYSHAGFIFFMARQDGLAIEQYRKALEIDPNYESAHGHLGEIYWYQGKYSESLDEREKAAMLFHEPAEIQQAVRQAYQRGGDAAATRKLLELDSNGRYPGYQKKRNIELAWLYAKLGEKSETLTCLERAFQEREPLLELVSVDRAWDFVRSEPRFQSIVQQMDLPTTVSYPVYPH
jgi:TolB-like protein/DNA-binding winged helix-turn-helix (wHTH) protein/Tfp pilus assembly protein PilF